MKFEGYPNATHHTPHVSRAELACRCGCKTPPDIEPNLQVTAEHLEDLRHVAGGYPLTIDCGYRCPAHNAAVGGEPDSQHLLGKAADVRQTGIHSPEQLAALAGDVDAYENGGIGTYPTEGFVHVDWRGYKARWDENSQ